MTTALFIGRFQPFHMGHLKALKEIAEKNDRVIIGVGSSNKSNTLRNPFTFEERREMIAAALEKEQLNYELYPIPDTGNDKLWVKQILETLPKFDKVYNNNLSTRLCFASVSIPAEETGNFEPYSASTIREKMAAAEQWESLVPVLL